MKFDEFLEKLKDAILEFKRDEGREAITVVELMDYVARRKFRKSGRKHLTSLKGFNI